MSTEETPPPNPRPFANAPELTLRRQILLSIVAESDRPLSTTELAHMTGQTLGATAHHVRNLARSGLLDWAGERRVRGALQTFYVINERGQRALRRARADILLALVGVAAPHAPVRTLDERAYDELSTALASLRPTIADIATRAAVRTDDEPDERAA